LTTTIAPSLGNGLAYTQAGVGTSPGFSAIDDRRASLLGLQEGVIDAGSYEVTQRAAGANLMSVDIAASTGGGAVVQGDSVTAQGLYYVGPHSAVINEAISTAHATLPRIDQVILEIQDTTHDSSGANAARVRVVTGTATAAATLDNRNGAAALPSNAIRLADVLVAATDTAISNSEIRDRRPWARGANVNMVGNVAGDITAAGAIAQFTKRVECSGAPMLIMFGGIVSNNTAGAFTSLEVNVDSVDIPTGAVGRIVSSNANEVGSVSVVVGYTPAAGSHVFTLNLGVSAGTGTLKNSATDLVPSFSITEWPRQNTANNATTSG
jgi:hypothetical protein